jgi:hypothetical protein
MDLIMVMQFDALTLNEREFVEDDRFCFEDRMTIPLEEREKGCESTLIMGTGR